MSHPALFGWVLLTTVLLACSGMAPGSSNNEQPNIVLIMTDDQGWGQVGYCDHPVLKTPNIDAMAAFDRAVGKLRDGLKKMGVHENTIVWFCSDNGGLPKITPETLGGLRGFKGSVFEGGIRVPGILEWPARIKPGVTRYPASTMDIFPTVADVLGLDESVMLKPVDGRSLVSIFDEDDGSCPEPIGFHFLSGGALVDNRYKYVNATEKKGKKEKKTVVALYDLVEDPAETTDVSGKHPEIFKRLKAHYEDWMTSVEKSVAGGDYPEGGVLSGPEKMFWKVDERYKAYLEQFQKHQERVRAELK